MAQRILVIDDEVDIRQLVALILETASYEVTGVGNGIEALDELARHRYDLVILDIMMPEMDGWDICRQIKGHPSSENVPVMILTVRSQPLDRVIGMEVVHADGYLTKPFDRHQLLATVARLIATPSTVSAPEAR